MGLSPVQRVATTRPIVEAVGKALHVYHGRGYCSEGQHDKNASYRCWEEARVVLDAINGVGTPDSYPDQGEHPMTLAARQAGKMERERHARYKERQRQGGAVPPSE